jgi:hypothetical protein
MNEKRKKIEEFIEEWLPAKHAGQKQDIAVLAAILLNENDLLNQLYKILKEINRKFKKE